MQTMRSGTPTQQLAELILGASLEDFIRGRRNAGIAWRFIARDLYEATDHKVDVTYETLRAWYPDPIPEPVADVEPLARSA
jgi:hypothetical protein